MIPNFFLVLHLHLKLNRKLIKFLNELGNHHFTGGFFALNIMAFTTKTELSLEFWFAQ